MKRILQVSRPVKFTVAVEVDDGEIGRIKVLTSATEAKMLLEQAADAMTGPTGLTNDERAELKLKVLP